MPLPFVNIAAYQFVALTDLEGRRRRLADLTRELGLKGTILLANEGINLFVSGRREAIDLLLTELARDPEIQDLEVKESFSEQVAFNRMLVKIKKEIIAFGIDEIDPARHTSPRIRPTELKQWLDEGREVLLLDVRNEFEIELGTFSDAKSPGIDSFRDFPTAASSLPDEWKAKPVVTFCTGGIRCEKAAPLLEQAGFDQVLQLDGGILKYFEDCGGDHYVGECFVFDRRVSVDSALHETDASLCFRCQRVLRPADRESAKYVEGESCPHCHDEEIDALERLTRRRRRLIRQFRQRLPGSRPYHNARPLNMPGRVDGFRLIDALREMFPNDPLSEWQERIRRGRIRDRRGPLQATDQVRGGQELTHLEPDCVEPPVNADIRILVEDEAWIVVDKPAPLPVHPCGRFHRHSLQWMLERADRRCRLRPAHRIDASTSGLQIFCKDAELAKQVHDQFMDRRVRKEYLARVMGTPPWDTTRCEAPISDTAGVGGRRQIDPNGAPSSTQFKVIRREGDQSTLLLARPETGRTHQVRLHLWHLGFPVLGDPMYLPDQQIGSSPTNELGGPSLCFHAWKLELAHPIHQETCRFETEVPDWAAFEGFQFALPDDTDNNSDTAGVVPRVEDHPPSSDRLN